MRQSQWECNDPAFFQEVFSQAEVLSLAINKEDGFPYAIPVNFVYLDGKLYFHSSLKGMKMDLIARDGRVGFHAASDILVSQEKSTSYYKSVCGTGLAQPVEDLQEKGKALDAIARRYHAACPVPTPENTLRHVGIVRIDVETLTGKRRLPREQG